MNELKVEEALQHLSHATNAAVALAIERDKLREAYELLLAWHDEVRRQMPEIPSPHGLTELRKNLEELHADE